MEKFGLDVHIRVVICGRRGELRFTYCRRWFSSLRHSHEMLREREKILESPYSRVFKIIEGSSWERTVYVTLYHAVSNGRVISPWGNKRKKTNPGFSIKYRFVLSVIMIPFYELKWFFPSRRFFAFDAPLNGSSSRYSSIVGNISLT